MSYHEEELRLSELVGSLQDLLLSTHDLTSFLEGVAVVASQVVEPPASCAIMTQHDGPPTTVATSDARASLVDQAQFDTGTGPCLETLATGEQVEVTDQRTDERWPSYGARAVDLGVRASLSVPLTSGDQTLGALNVYGYERPREFGEDEKQRIAMFASQASTALTLAIERTERERTAHQLEKAFVSRAVIDQAIGVLMAQEKCTADQAFALLRQHSQNNNRKLRDVAVDLITRLTGHPPDVPTEFQRPGETTPA
jgi:GAF domain-containing protein